VGGTEVYTHGLATRARRAGHSVTVITHAESASLNRNDYQVVPTEYEGIPVREIHHNLSRAENPARAEYENPEVAVMVRDELCATMPDIVHAMHAMKLSGAALQACYDLGIPVVLTLVDYWMICPRHILVRSNNQLCNGPAHDLDCLECLNDTHGFASGRLRKLPAAMLRRGASFGSQLSNSRFWRDVAAIRKREAYLRQIVERAVRVMALSQFQKDIFVRNGYPAARIEVLHHGLETEGLHAPSFLPAEDFEVVFIGSLVAHKGPHILVKALAQRPDARVRLLIYGSATGSNPYLDSLKQLAARDKRVKLMGTFDRRDIGRVLQSAHALAMPALWYENEPLVVKAAQFIGLPVLASDIGTLATSIKPGVNGKLIPPGDVEAWAEALSSIDLSKVPPDRSIKSMDQNAVEIFAIYGQVLAQQCSAQTT